MVRYPSQTLRQGGQSPIGKVGHEWKLGGAASFFEAGAFVLQQVPYRIVADLDPAFCQRAAKPACFVIQFAGKSSGRTGDKAIISAVSDKPLPVYFLKDADLKEQMVQGHPNPLKATTFIVDADVQLVDGEPKGYRISHVHKIIDSGE
jgi:hypothetical protein